MYNSSFVSKNTAEKGLSKYDPSFYPFRAVAYKEAKSGKQIKINKNKTDQEKKHAKKTI